MNDNAGPGGENPEEGHPDQEHFRNDQGLPEDGRGGESDAAEEEAAGGSEGFPQGFRRRRRRRQRPAPGPPASADLSEPASPGPSPGGGLDEGKGESVGYEGTPAGTDGPAGGPGGEEGPGGVSRAPRFVDDDDGPRRSILSGRAGEEAATATREDAEEDLDEYEYEEDEEGYDDEYTLRDRIGDRVYEGREWVAQSPWRVALAVGAVVAALAIFFALAHLIFSGGGHDAPAAASKQAGPGGNPGGTPGDAQGLKPAQNAGDVRVSIDAGGKVTVSHALGSKEQRWTGRVERRPPPKAAGASGTQSTDTVYVALSGPSEGTFQSVLAESGARSWLGQIFERTSQGDFVQAVQTSDPGAAALDGRVPVVRGTYVVKGSEGAGRSASGTYEDTLVDQSTMERVYSETFVNSQGQAQSRSWRVEYHISGDGALLPLLVGYEPPTGSGGPQ